MTKGSGDARMQPLYFIITTAGTDTNSICYEIHQKAKDIIEGRKHDRTFYPIIYGADESEDWTDPKVWKKANPSLGIKVPIDKVEDACNSAKENPGEENAFRQLRLNQWVKQAVRWMSMEKWDKCKVAFDEELLAGRVFVMVDLTFPLQRILQLLFWYFLQQMMTSITTFCPTSGCQRKLCLCVSEETMFHMIFGNGRAI